MKNIMNILFLSCKRATELLEKKHYVQLSGIERVQLKIHKLMCPPCSKYEKQSNLLEKCLEQNHIASNAQNTDITALKETISQKLASK